MTKDVYAGMLLGSKIKLNTIINVVQNQTIPVKRNGDLCFPGATKNALKAAAVNPMDYVLQTEVERANKGQGKDWLETKMQYKQLKFYAHCLTITQKTEVEEIMKKTQEITLTVKKIE